MDNYKANKVDIFHVMTTALRASTLRALIVFVSLLIVGCSVFKGPTISGTDLHSKASAPIIRDMLQLWKEQPVGGGNWEWLQLCMIPVPQTGTTGAVVVNMENNSYGCPSNEVQGYKLLGGAKLKLGFYDMPCDDRSLYDHTYYEYDVTKIDLETGLMKSLKPGVAVGSEVVSGLTYEAGADHGEIDGKLSCVIFFSIQ